MKRKAFFLLLIVETLLLGALVLLSGLVPTVFSSLLAFPFEQLGAVLRLLSLRGGVYNGFAMALWMASVLLPLLPVLAHLGERARLWEHLTLALTAAVLGDALFRFANPAAWGVPEPAMHAVMNAILGGTVWSLLICWAVLRLLRHLRSGGEVYGCLRALLYGLCALFVGTMAVSGAGELARVLTGEPRSLDIAFAVLSCAAAALPYGMDTAVTLSGVSLLERLLAGERAEATACAEALSRRCCLALGAVTAATAGMNVLQVVFAAKLPRVNVEVQLPLISLAFVLGALVLARLIAENGRLSDENDSFI